MAGWPEDVVGRDWRLSEDPLEGSIVSVPEQVDWESPIEASS